MLFHSMGLTCCSRERSTSWPSGAALTIVREICFACVHHRRLDAPGCAWSSRQLPRQHLADPIRQTAIELGSSHLTAPVQLGRYVDRQPPCCTAVGSHGDTADRFGIALAGNECLELVFAVLLLVRRRLGTGYRECWLLLRHCHTAFASLVVTPSRSSSSSHAARSSAAAFPLGA